MLLGLTPIGDPTGYRDEGKGLPWITMDYHGLPWMHSGSQVTRGQALSKMVDLKELQSVSVPYPDALHDGTTDVRSHIAQGFLAKAKW